MHSQPCNSPVPLLLLLLLLLLLVSPVASTTSAPASANSTSRSLQSHVLTSLATSLLAAPYNSQVRPDLDKRVPVIVNISIYIIEVTATNEVNMDFSTSMYFRRIWYDDRLTYSSSLTDVLSIGFMVDRVWQPDIYFLNEKAGVFHTIAVPNILLQVSPDGRVILSTKYTLSLSCQFQLELYPMDSQVCSIEFGSYGYRTSDIILRWNDAAAVVLSDVAKSLPEYDVVKSMLHDCTTGYEVTGRYTCLRVSLHMRRKFNYYLIQVYIPSTLVVVLSWVSFWIDHHATPARITLSLLTVLTITTQSSSVTRSGMPRVSYIKSIDVWLTGCLTFVFMALIEYAVVNVVQRKSGMLRTADKWQRPKKLLEVANIIRMSLAQVRPCPENAAAAATAAASPTAEAETEQPNCNTIGVNNNSDAGGKLDGSGDSSTVGGLKDEEDSNRLAAEDLGWIFRHKGDIEHWLGLRCLCHKTPQQSGMTDAEFVDFLAKRIFPAAFLLFNTIYWAYYKTMQIVSYNSG